MIGEVKSRLLGIHHHKCMKNAIDTKLAHIHIPLHTGIITFIIIIITRIGIEAWMTAFAPHDFAFYFYEFIHTFFFFSILYFLCVFLTTWIAQIDLRSSLILFLFGFILIIFPPIFDRIIIHYFFGDNDFLSYYLFDGYSGLWQSYLTYFGDMPRNGITYGTRIMIGCVLGVMLFLTYLNTSSIWRTVLMIWLSYTSFFLLSAFPSFITFIFSDVHFHAVGATVAGFIASPTVILNNHIENPINAINIKMSQIYITLFSALIMMITFFVKRKLFFELCKNVRPIQTIYHFGLLIIGMGLSVLFADAVFHVSFFSINAFVILCIALVCAWYSTVIFNDIVDQDIDKISNTTRPLITGIIDVVSYRNIGIALTFYSIIITTAVSFYATIAIIAYHGWSYLYNTPPFRLKKYPVIATFVAAIASFHIVLAGYIVYSPDHSIHGFPIAIAALLIIVYTISLPIKDLKDIKGDKENKIYTIPVLCGERVGRLIIAINIFISFMISIYALNNRALLIPALFSGILCFWALVGSTGKKFIFDAHSTLRVVFVVVALYACILANSLFM